MHDTPGSRKHAAISFLQLAGSGHVREAFERFLGPGFRHHNPWFKGDAASLLSAMEESAVNIPNKSFEVQNALEDGDTVAVHSHLRLAGGAGMAVVHICRFHEGRIVELWDVGQVIPEDSPNENGMF